MFKVTDNHLDAFAQKRVASFATRMIDRLNRIFIKELAAQHIKEADLLLLVRQGIAAAEQYRVVGEMDVEFYIDCMVLLGRRFDSDPRFPWAGKCLQRSDIDGTTKMDLIHDHLVFATDKAR